MERETAYRDFGICGTDSIPLDLDQIVRFALATESIGEQQYGQSNSKCITSHPVWLAKVITS